MEPEFSPLVRRLRLGRELRDIREGRKLTLVQAAQQAGWSKGQLSRIERGETKPDTGMVMDLLELYRVDEIQYAALVTLARQAARTGWWNRHSGVTAQQRGLAELESGAEALRVFNPVCVPGLLQTADYAATRMRAGAALEADPGDIAATVKLRIQRQEVLRRIKLHVILDEAVLYRRLSSPDVRFEQMKSLIFQAQHKLIHMQILPFDRHTDDEVAALAPFTIFEYPPPDSAMVVIELPTGSIQQESEDEAVTSYQALYGRLADAAVSPEKSVEMMESLLDEI